MKLKLLFTFLLLIFLQTIGFGRSGCNVVRRDDFTGCASSFIAEKFTLNESKDAFIEIQPLSFFRKCTFGSIINKFNNMCTFLDLYFVRKNNRESISQFLNCLFWSFFRE